MNQIITSKEAPQSTLLIKEGTLSNKDIIGTDSACGKIKTMEDFSIKSY